VPISLRPIAGSGEIETCARMMESSEPWITLGRGYEAGLSMLRDESRERQVAILDEAIAGFVVMIMQGPLAGYLQTICVAPQARGKGVGSALMQHAEALVFARHPNFFLMVSDFNRCAQAFYARLGYQVVGTLVDYLVEGRSEILMRKTRGPIRGYPRICY
jgi:[ribosomal protein S18]-alanine N-acetyltransferase